MSFSSTNNINVVLLLIFGLVVFFSLLYIIYKYINFTILYYFLIVGLYIYYFYLISIYSGDDPNQTDVVGATFQNTRNWIYEFNIPRFNNENSNSIVLTETDTKNINLLKEGYILGFRLESGIPSESWVNNAKSRLSELGVKKYYTELFLANQSRIKALVGSNIIVHDEDTFGESIYKYNSFDVVESIKDNHLYTYSRLNWDWLLKNKICMYTRAPLSKIVLKTLESRKKLAVHLPVEPVLFPIEDSDILELSNNSVIVKVDKEIESSGSITEDIENDNYCLLKDDKNNISTKNNKSSKYKLKDVQFKTFIKASKLDKSSKYDKNYKFKSERAKTEIIPRSY